MPTITVVRNELARALDDATVTVAQLGSLALSAFTDHRAAATDDPNRLFIVNGNSIILRISYPLAGDQLIYGAYLINHNLSATATVRLEGADSVAQFGGAAPVDTGPVTLVAGLGPLFDRNGYLLSGVSIGDTARRYWQLTITNTTGYLTWVGEIWLARKEFFFPFPVEFDVGDGQLDWPHGFRSFALTATAAVDRYASHFGSAWNSIRRSLALSIRVETESKFSLSQVAVSSLSEGIAFTRRWGRRPLILVPWRRNPTEPVAGSDLCFFVRMRNQSLSFDQTPDRITAFGDFEFEQMPLVRPLNYQ